MTISSPLENLAAETTAEKIADLKRRREEAHAPMGPAAHEKVRSQERLTARDRLDYLLDEGSFVETDQLARHRTQDFGMGHAAQSPTASSPAGAPSTAAKSASSRRTAQSLAAHSVRSTAKRW